MSSLIWLSPGDWVMMRTVQPDDLSQQRTRWLRSEENGAGSDYTGLGVR
jgi:hypothetical protein